MLTTPMPTPLHRERGFTLIELIVTMAVVAILVAVGIPNFRTFLQNNRITTQANSFISAMSLARSEALKQNANITVCASDDQATCDSNNWSEGWIVFQDDTATGAPADPATAELVQIWPAVDGEMTLTGADADGSVDYIRFLPTGLTDQSSNTTFTLDIPDCTGKQQRAITLSITGNVAVSHVACTS